MKNAWVAALLCVAMAANAQDSRRHQVLSAPNGRFVLGQIGDQASSQYLLDTQTGRVWEVVNMTDGKVPTGASALRQVKFVTADGVVWGIEPPQPLPTKP